MEMRTLGGTGLRIAPLVFGGNVFGWTADQKASFALLDRFVDAGLNAIDTADAYQTWIPGHKGGESETVIGAWLKANPSKRDKVLILTKVGSDMGEGRKGLKEPWIMKAVEDSLRRLQVDVIDLYQSHWPDPSASYEETLGAYAKLLKAGKVRAIGCSNLDAAQLSDALAVSKSKGLPRYESLQPGYNLHDREKFEGPLAELCIREGVGVISYFGLASGFLTGKYRTEADLAKSARGYRVKDYMNPRGMKILAALDVVAERTGATQAEIALAWLIGRPGLTAPIASATSLPQLEGLIRAANLKLTDEDARTLTDASAY